MRRFAVGLGVVILLVLMAGFSAAQVSSERYTWNFMLSDVPASIPQYPSVGVGDDGTVWVAYMDGSDHKYVNVTWYDGSTWHNDVLYQGDFTLVGDAAGAPPIALCVVGNVPHVFYYTYENSGVAGSLNHSYYENGAWHTETVWHGSLTDNTGKPVNSVSVEYVNGTFYVLFQAYSVNALSTPYNALYLVSGTTGSWSSPVSVASGDTYHLFFGDLAVYNSTKIGISIYEEYSNPNSGKTYYVLYTEYDGSSFTALENISSNTGDYMARLTFNSTGAPHIFLGYEINSNGATYLREIYKTSSGTWISQYIDTRANNPGGPLDAALAPNGDMVIAYNIDGQSGIQFSEYSGGAWNLEEISDTLSGNALRHMPSIAFDSAGNIYVAYVNWDAVKADNYYIVVATNNSAVPEFGEPLILLTVIFVAAVFIRSRP